MATEVGCLEAAALKRKEKLALLRASKTKLGPGSEESDPRPIFRSYQPVNEEFQGAVLPQVSPSEVKELVKDELDKERQAILVENLDFTSLAPRKPDWDLKRDVAPKLAKLERKTQKAIAELIRERLKQEDLANAVAAAASTAQQLNSDDEDS